MNRLKPVGKSQFTSLRMSRRGVVLFGLVAVSGGGAVKAQRYAAKDGVAVDALSPAQAHASARSGKILLIDIRRPDEWSRTGIGEGAIGIDMRRRDFEETLVAAANGNKNRPVALICARGVRSRRMSERLAAAGFTNVLDVPEGMLGSNAGPGWLKRDLPVVAFE